MPPKCWTNATSFWRVNIPTREVGYEISPLHMCIPYHVSIFLLFRLHSPLPISRVFTFTFFPIQWYIHYPTHHLVSWMLVKSYAYSIIFFLFSLQEHIQTINISNFLINVFLIFIQLVLKNAELPNKLFLLIHWQHLNNI